MRLIDADALLKTLNEEKITFNSDVNYFIMHAPTIDAVLVTRCKDCVLSERVENNRTLCRLIGMKVDGNGYCECGQKNVN